MFVNEFSLLGRYKTHKMKYVLWGHFFYVETALCLFFSRSTKLVIIERLLLLAERYVITIEVNYTV